jgi:hypothetical protein
MAQGRKLFDAIGGMPLIRLQRSAVRDRLRVMEPGDCATDQQERAPSQSKGSGIDNRTDTGRDCCEARS